MPKRFFDKRFPTVPTPGEWLGDTLQKNKVGQNLFAKILDTDRGQLSRLLSDKESLPDYMVDYVCDYFGLSDRSTPREYVYIKNKIESLWVFSERNISSDDRPDRFSRSEWELIISTVLQSVDRCAWRMRPGSEAARVQYVSRYLSDAHYALRAVARAALVERSRDGPGLLFTEEDAARHLQFPMNVLIGDLIKEFLGTSDSPTMSGVVDSLRYISESKRSGEFRRDQARQHAQHMRARYGGVDDAECVADSLAGADVWTRRMILFGQFLGQNNQDVLHRILREMRDESFLHSVLIFDALHYGDLSPHEFWNLKLPSKFHSSTKQILVQIYTSNDDSIIDLNISKFLNSLAVLGIDRIFDHDVLRHLRKAYDRIKDEDMTNTSRMDFMRISTELLGDDEQ